RFAERGGNAIPILHGDGDHVHAARDPGFDDFVLPRRIRIGRAVPKKFYAKRLGGLFRALSTRDEIGVPFAFRHKGYSDLFAARNGGLVVRRGVILSTARQKQNDGG